MPIEPIRARPELTDAEALAVLTNGQVDIVGRMPWSSNATFLVDVGAVDGLPAAQGIYKPARGERPLWDFPSGLYQRERAAYVLSALLRWDLVPPTVVRDGPLGPGSLQLVVPTSYEQHYFTLFEDEDWHPVLQRLCAFDVVANSTDRKSGHVLLSDHGDLFAIDNGLSFHEEFKLRTVIWEWGGDPIPTSISDDLLAAADAGWPLDLTALLSADEIEALDARLHALVRAGHFPVDHTGRRYPWPLV
jgi:uncharacterized repeat protein (TIGR03843 family)